jgi:cold shock CspA family protein
MTAAEVRAFAAGLLAMIGDAPQQILVARTVRQFYPEKGRGSVRLADGSARDNVFFHRSVVEGGADADLVPGRSVRLVIEVDAGRGPRASRMVLA